MKKKKGRVSNWSGYDRPTASYLKGNAPGTGQKRSVVVGIKKELNSVPGNGAIQ